jgi:hypothetical protein
MEVSGQLQAPSALPSGKKTGTHWVRPRAGLDSYEENKILLPLPGF